MLLRPPRTQLPLRSGRKKRAMLLQRWSWLMAMQLQAVTVQFPQRVRTAMHDLVLRLCQMTLRCSIVPLRNTSHAGSQAKHVGCRLQA